MRIGIISLPLHTNYGGILQAYALQTVLQRMGHDVKVIDREWMPFPSVKQLCRLLPERFIKKYIKGQEINLLPQQYYDAKQYQERSLKTRSFIRQNINLRLVKSLNDLCSSEFDVIIVGSDQVLRPKYFAGWGNIKDAYLDFAKRWKIKRLFYAASFGCDECEYTPKQIDILKVLVKKFDGISVREKEGVKLFHDYLCVEAIHVLDPTLLLLKEDYYALLQNAKFTRKEGTLFNYILDETAEKISLMERVARERKLKPFRINKSESLRIHGIQASIEEWLAAFANAEFVVTDSFHACVFSILFGKPFIAVGNKDRGVSRFTSLLYELSLSQNLLLNTSDYVSTIDYSPSLETYSKLEELREKSLQFLTDKLSI